LRVFEILINISTNFTETEGFILKNTKRGGNPSHKKTKKSLVSVSYFLLKETKKTSSFGD